MIKVGIAGCNGRMGQLLMKEVDAASNMKLVGGCDRDTEMKAEHLFEIADLVIDFTSIDASLKHAELAAKNDPPPIIESIPRVTLG